MGADEVVTAFCGCWERLDADEMADYFAADATYQNGTMELAKGKDAIREVLAGMSAAMDDLKIIVHRQVVSGSIVMNERTDLFHMFGRLCELPIVGVFEVTDGKITYWREYFDMEIITMAIPELTNP